MYFAVCCLFLSSFATKINVNHHGVALQAEPGHQVQPPGAALGQKDRPELEKPAKVGPDNKALAQPSDSVAKPPGRSSVMNAEYAIGMLFIPPVLGLLWAIFQVVLLYRMDLKSISVQKPLLKTGPEQLEDEVTDQCPDEERISTMIRVAGYIDAGAQSYLKQQYTYLFVALTSFAVVVAVFASPAGSIAFMMGGLTSILCGYLSMRLATITNVRTAYSSWISLNEGFFTAMRGGIIMGLLLTSIGTIMLGATVIMYYYLGDDGRFWLGHVEKQKNLPSGSHLFEAVCGFGLGASFIALFGRVGGGIYTKAADVGADLTGKNEYGLNEDDPRNPACIADNVGDNVGDVAGMGADLFGSFAEATCAAMLVFACDAKVENEALISSFTCMLLPLLISSYGILSGLITFWILGFTVNLKENRSVEPSLKLYMFISTLVQTPFCFLLPFLTLPEKFQMESYDATWMTASICIVSGLWIGLAIGSITEYYTSHAHAPVREIAEALQTSASTGLIFGIAMGYMSTLLPACLIAGALCLAHQLCGIYGIALSALGMLSTLSVSLAIDGYGPICDNAGGIAEMSGLPKFVRERTDALDAAGNTTAAVGKGFAVGSACLVGFALFGGFTVRCQISTSNNEGNTHHADIMNPWSFLGILIGANLPFTFSALLMKSVGLSAQDIVRECQRQFPLIMKNIMEPDYDSCIRISTQSALRHMLLPGALVIFTPLIGGILFGENFVCGLLAGIISAGVMMGLSMSNSGGAFDNSKKYIEAGGLGPAHLKGSEAHKHAVICDTLGDPLKDTAGPSVNILIKLSAIISLVFADLIHSRSSSSGGPFWLEMRK